SQCGGSVGRMNRRAFVTGLEAVLAAPRAAEAQAPAKQARIGYLRAQAEGPTPAFRRVFIETLGQYGWERGKNLHIEVRNAGGVNDALPRLAAELIPARVDVITTIGETPATLAAKRATTTIPIVFTSGTDPVLLGIVPSLGRPGGNVTGFGAGLTLTQKRL